MDWILLLRVEEWTPAGKTDLCKQGKARCIVHFSSKTISVLGSRKILAYAVLPVFLLPSVKNVANSAASRLPSQILFFCCSHKG